MKVPLSILTGWLGSGKTTLVNHIISTFSKEGKKVALIENETSGVESSVVVGNDGEIFRDIIELANGCVCCTVRDDFVAGVEALVKRKQFDYIILECSGLADPGVIASMFWLDEELEAGVYLDGLIGLVDAKFFLSHLDKSHAKQVLQQLAYADRIIINKQDLVSEAEIVAVEQRVRQINASAGIFRSTHSQIPLHHILHINALDVASVGNQLQQPTLVFSEHDHEHHAHSHQHPQTPTSDEKSLDSLNTCLHDEAIRSLEFSVGPDRCIDLQKLNLWLADILWERSIPLQEIYRMKGVFHVCDDDRAHYLQAVQNLFQIEPSLPWNFQPPSIQKGSKILIIGKHLDENQLSTSFHACFVAANS